MTEPTDTQPWDTVFNRVRARYDPSDKYVRRPTRAELDFVEQELGSQLPASYRAFAERFAVPGHVVGYLRLRPLRDKREGSSVVDLTRWFRNEGATERRAHEYGPLEQLRRLVIFGDDYGGGSFAWDSGDVTCSDPLEYRIVRIPREPMPLAPIADTFFDCVQWVHNYCLEMDEHIDAPPEERCDPSYIRFEPFFLRAKRIPVQADVVQWLAFNGNAARDLALSIRDHGCTDALPILADALQEAGCTNADLLDSCRTGDPGIDGPWVLRVLGIGADPV